MKVQYSKRIKLMRAICLAETLQEQYVKRNVDFNEYDTIL